MKMNTLSNSFIEATHNTVDLLGRLVAFPSVSRTPNRDLIDYVRTILEEAGIATETVTGGDDANANLFATIGPTDVPGVVLSGHTDVVPTVGQNWTVDPFKLTKRDGRLYGRGTTDMKGFIACAIRAAILAKKRPLKRPLHLAFSYDEEIGCVGVRHLLDWLQTSPHRAAFCLIGEPTSLSVATGHKGKMALRATFHGREIHSALAPGGLNAIHLASEFIQILRKEQQNLAERGSRDGDYDIPYSTIHAGIISGGTALNIVPNEAVVDFEIRHLKADDPQAILGAIKSSAGEIVGRYRDDFPEASVEIKTVNAYPGLDTPPDAEIVSFIKSLTGANATIKVAFGTEGGLFSEKLEVPTVVCGPGSMQQGHKPDEFITEDQLNLCDRMLETLIDRLCAD